MRPGNRVLLISLVLFLLSCFSLASLTSRACVWNPIACFSTSQVLSRLGPFKAMSEQKAAGDILHFPEGFMWGTATASYQIEGGADARGQTIWDDFCAIPGRVANGDNGSVACDHYHRYKSDVELMASLGTKYYRFSIAWARLFPTQDAAAPAEEGVSFYKSLIAELVARGIVPVATLYHWDLPSWVQKSTGGWAGNGSIADAFEKYARTCFELFGDDVKWWITLNEPWCSTVLGYETGEHAPGETDKPGRKVYVAGHNLLRAHAKAVAVYRKEFREVQNGKIGITLNTDWAEPRGADGKEAGERDMQFSLGWFADPVYFGDYPAVMQEAAGDRLPTFTDAEKVMLKGSSDFFGLNHYSSHYTTGVREPGKEISYWNDKRTNEERNEKWESTDMGWAIVPAGFGRVLSYISKRYNPPGGIIVTENGLAARERNEEEMKENKSRVKFYGRYIGAMHEAIKNGADVRGYFLWSFMDNFEWAFGYEKRFGLFYVDYKTQTRTPKPAVHWYRDVVTSNAVKVEWDPKDLRF